MQINVKMGLESWEKEGQSGCPRRVNTSKNDHLGISSSFENKYKEVRNFSHESKQMRFSEKYFHPVTG